MKTKAEALKAARHARSLLNHPTGWKVEVWNNGGWHYHLVNGPMRLCPSHGDFSTKFFCLLSDTMTKGYGGSALWSTRFTHANPNKVIAYQIAVAQRRLNELVKIKIFLDRLSSP
jgi:hypothetical protein